VLEAALFCTLFIRGCILQPIEIPVRAHFSTGIAGTELVMALNAFDLVSVGKGRDNVRYGWVRLAVLALTYSPVHYKHRIAMPALGAIVTDFFLSHDSYDPAMPLSKAAEGIPCGGHFCMPLEVALDVSAQSL